MNTKSMFPVWEEGMNPEQIEAIRHTEGPAAVLATAGSGKTRALVHRIARMVADGVAPESVLAVTFSKKAGDEMNKRLKQLDVKDARVGTWHSLCLQILRQDETRWASWDIDDTDRFSLMIKEALGYKFLDWKGADPTIVGAYIGLCKANLELPNSDEAFYRAERTFGHNARLAYGAYQVAQQLCTAARLLTFDDFLVNVWSHLQNEEVRLRWANHWSFLLQDEAQDSNVAQREIAKLLAKDHRNYMIVGDPAQSIYGFRGSQPSFILSFEEEWDAKLIIMNRNYRSGSQIIQVANDVIRTGVLRLPTDMKAERGIDGNVLIHKFTAPEDEGRELTTWIESYTKADEAKVSDFAVLYRTNAQSRALEEALLKAKIPYVVVGGVSFYERREVKNLLAYLRVAAGRGDAKDVQRCINAPFRYLGNAFVTRLMTRATEVSKPDWIQLIRDVARETGLQDRQRYSALDWARLIESARERMDGNFKASDVLNSIIEETRYIEWVKKDEGSDSTENSHADNIRELVGFAHQYTVDGLLDYIEGIKEAAKKNKDTKYGDRVVLMSIHRSKGLEWPYVFVAGINEGLLPHKKGDIEEERRLMYVAVTRARDGLVLSYSSECPSRFLYEADILQENDDED